MRDVLSYFERDPETRLADLDWEDLEEETTEDRLERIQAEPRNRHHLDRGDTCDCPDCRANRAAAASPAAEGSTRRPCGDRHGGLRCNVLVRRGEDGEWEPHRGAHGAFTRGGDYVQW